MNALLESRSLGRYFLVGLALGCIPMLNSACVSGNCGDAPYFEVESGAYEFRDAERYDPVEFTDEALPGGTPHRLGARAAMTIDRDAGTVSFAYDDVVEVWTIVEE